MARLGIYVLWISETRWPGEDDYKSGAFRIIHSGAVQSWPKDKRTASCVEKVQCEGDRLLLVKLTEKPVHTCVIQVYTVFHKKTIWYLIAHNFGKCWLLNTKKNSPLEALGILASEG